MNYKISMGKWGKVFAVPSSVVEDYIKLASGQAIKVLLYILYKGDCSADEIAAALNSDTEAITDAIAFWEQIGLFSEDAAPISDRVQNEIDEIPIQKQTENTKAVHSLKRSVSPKEIAERVNSSEEIKFLFNYAESVLGHLLTNTEQNSLLWIHDYLGMPSDIMMMLFEYCKVYGKMSMQYIERSAASWQEKEIITHEQAEEEIENAKRRLLLSNKIKNAFGINRHFTAKEIEYISNWTAFGYDIDLITYAYEKTIDSIGKIQFAYINKILDEWYKNGLTSRSLIDSNDKERPKFAGKPKSEKEPFYEEDPFELAAVNIKRYKEKYKGD